MKRKYDDFDEKTNFCVCVSYTRSVFSGFHSYVSLRRNIFSTLWIRNVCNGDTSNFHMQNSVPKFERLSQTLQRLGVCFWAFSRKGVGKNGCLIMGMFLSHGIMRRLGK